METFMEDNDVMDLIDYLFEEAGIITDEDIECLLDVGAWLDSCFADYYHDVMCEQNIEHYQGG
jgi:hypothetical protein